MLADLERGVSPRRSGQLTAGIGAAMRIAPVALYFGDDRDVDVRLGHGGQHHDPPRRPQPERRAGGRPRGPAAGGRRAARSQPACSGSPPTSPGTRARIAAEYGDVVISLDQHARGLSRALAHAESVLDQPRERALAALVEEANRHGAEPACKRPTMGFPPACIPTCLYLLLTTDSFEEAITEVINLGGDTDTAGAILGALAGAHYGVGDIPKRWLDGLQNRDGIDARAIALAHRSADGLDIPDLIATEQELSRKEGANLERYASFSANGGDRGANHVI